MSAQCPVPKSSIDDIKPSLLMTYNLSEGDDNFDCTGCDLLPNGDFVIADQNVPYVKYYNNQGVLKKQINTGSGKPWDVCFIDNNTIAVSIAWSSPNHEHILFVNTTDNKVIKKVHVGRGGKRLYFHKVLVVGNSLGKDSKVLTIDLNGDIKNESKTSTIGGVFASKKMIYYTHLDEDAVVCCDESGNIKWSYQDPSVKRLCRIVVNDQGFVFVSCRSNDSVIAISPDGQTSRVILRLVTGFNNSRALAINSNDRKLMLCNRDDGQVFLYQL